ncbi:MAG: hypothetical protein U0169_15595 [Polyangiaceae bacterium]
MLHKLSYLLSVVSCAAAVGCAGSPTSSVVHAEDPSLTSASVVEVHVHKAQIQTVDVAEDNGRKVLSVGMTDDAVRALTHAKEHHDAVQVILGDGKDAPSLRLREIPKGSKMIVTATDDAELARIQKSLAN